MVKVPLFYGGSKMTDVVVSIYPKFTNLIKTGDKNYEFRKYVPKRGVDRLWIYSSSPECSLEYMAEIDKIVEFPQKIAEEGIGNNDFNNGLKKSKFAYHINHLYKLISPLSLEKLRSDFGFSAPQCYFYLDSNDVLRSFLLKQNLKRVF